MNRLPALLTVTLGLLWPGTSWAHALLAQGKVLADKIVVEAFYDDATPAKAALVKVFLGDKMLCESMTDAEGSCTLPRPDPGDYRVLINAGAGHRAVIRLHVASKTAVAVTETPPNSGPDEIAHRAEIARYPWLKVGVGLSAIGLLSLAFWVARRMSEPRPSGSG